MDSTTPGSAPPPGPPKIKYCRQCGTLLEEGAKVCGACQWPVSGVRMPVEGGMPVGIKVLIGVAVAFFGIMFIGILAAIAIPKYANTKQKAYVAMQKTDLRNLATAEESYWADHQTYTTSAAAMNYSAEKSITVTITHASSQGWVANTRHPATKITCQVGFGVDSIRGVGDGVIQCK